jgi:isoleucyl-tRNA synthetase
VSEVRAALRAGEFEELPGGGVRAAGIDLSPDEVLREERIRIEPAFGDGWVVVQEGPISLALQTTLDEELLLEGRVLDMIRTLNELRKTEGLELTDRIRVELPERETDLLGHADWIKDEVLAVSVVTDPTAIQPRIERA